MEKMQTFSVDFLIRRCKADKLKALIYARITVNGVRTEISLKEQIKVADWNSEKGILKSKSVEAKKMNEYIDNVRFRIKEKYRMLETREQLITPEAIKKAYFGVQIELKGKKLNQLLDYYKKIWEAKLKKGGFKNYKTTIQYARLFLSAEYESGDIYLSQVNMQLATEFEHYIRNHPIKEHDPCRGNGVGKHVQRFKRILNWGVEIEWIKANPIEKYSCPLKKSKRKKLDMQEVVSIENKAFHSPVLMYVKDLFLNSCYTGLAYADAMSIEESDFEWEVGGRVWCKKYRVKSDELCAVPLLDLPSAILKKYREAAILQGRKTIFPKITNQTVNDSLKIIQEVCGITTLLTFHVARHTFAKTIALKNGVPLETVQMMMGHSKITTTQIYADVDEEKILDDISGLDQRINRKKELLQHTK
jgi:site-specific recombinase XerD